MASQYRSSSSSLAELEKLSKHANEYSFFEAIRILDSCFKESPRTGSSDRPLLEKIRISQIPTLKFQASSVSKITKKKNGNHWELAQNVFGVFGPNGAMPIHITDFAEQRIRQQRDETFARFVDMFQHRMASFFYRAWASAQPTVQMDRPDTDRFFAYVASLAGIGMKSLQSRDAMPDHTKVHFSSYFGNSVKCSGNLESILKQFFGSEAKVAQFVGKWITLPTECEWHLGKDPDSGSLGKNMALGSRVLTHQQHFRVTLGPLPFEKFRRLLPGGDSLQRLTDTINNYVGFELTWELQLSLRKEEVPKIQLGRQGNLGWTTWFPTKVRDQDAVDLIIDPANRSTTSI